MRFASMGLFRAYNNLRIRTRLLMLVGLAMIGLGGICGAYLESWNTDCKIYNPGDAVAIYAQYNSSGSSFDKIGDFPLTVRRGYVHIVETHGTASSPSVFRR